MPERFLFAAREGVSQGSKDGEGQGWDLEAGGNWSSEAPTRGPRASPPRHPATAPQGSPGCTSGRPPSVRQSRNHDLRRPLHVGSAQQRPAETGARTEEESGCGAGTRGLSAVVTAPPWDTLPACPRQRRPHRAAESRSHRWRGLARTERSKGNGFSKSQTPAEWTPGRNNGRGGSTRNHSSRTRWWNWAQRDFQASGLGDQSVCLGFELCQGSPQCSEWFHNEETEARRSEGTQVKFYTAKTGAPMDDHQVSPLCPPCREHKENAPSSVRNYHSGTWDHLLERKR